MITVKFILRQAWKSFSSRFGIIKPIRASIELIKFINQYVRYKEMYRTTGKKIRFELHPCLHEKNDDGIRSYEYFHQDRLILQRLTHATNLEHADIGSRLDGFISALSLKKTVHYFDIRRPSINIENVIYHVVDMSFPRSFGVLDGYFKTISCLHAIEHFGLGRYGDRQDVYGVQFGLINIRRLLEVGGKLFLSIPIGEPRIIYNANRVFSVLEAITILTVMKFSILDFSYVSGTGRNGELIRHANIYDGIMNNFSLHQGLGIFELEKLP